MNLIQLCMSPLHFISNDWWGSHCLCFIKSESESKIILPSSWNVAIENVKLLTPQADLLWRKTIYGYDFSTSHIFLCKQKESLIMRRYLEDTSL